jgi:hypothetical protein
MNTLYFKGKLVDPTPANTYQTLNKGWGLVLRPSPTYGPDAYGAKYKQLGYEYEPVKDRTAIRLQPIVDNPTKK